MTKMHFQRAAEVVNAIREGKWYHGLPDWADQRLGVECAIELSTEVDGNISVDYVRAVWTAEAFIILFKEYNPRFNEAKFLKACGLGESK
jgi:hypothetical protein